ncbi:hypothetical protein [Algisphaera agarilytica]|uniref:PEP-CTERM protein-sorting domain-containing protein n=1 Tax=Algisphaera agarilytica TaxID=1385975 RepID=A0A7X0LLM8_9BACT|nr:hypothetical protein [Algisphaera agarilytica]MBB6431177.1 hypothetical protein [Algisphaera agarilytica]
MFKSMTFVAALTLSSIAGVAQAGSSYSFEANRIGKAFYNQDGEKISAGINDKAGKVHSFSGEYNEKAQTFSWSVTANKRWDSLWLVVNSGGNPKTAGQQGKIGMIYFSRENGNNLSIYKYQNANSYKTQELIASSKNDDSFIKSMGFTKDKNKRTGEFTLDVSAINKAFGDDGIGLAYGETIGVWMHVFDRRGKNGAVYGKDGGLVDWDYKKHGWVDTDGFGTAKAVPTPSAAAAGIVGIAIALHRRRKAEAA